MKSLRPLVLLLTLLAFSCDTPTTPSGGTTPVGDDGGDYLVDSATGRAIHHRYFVEDGAPAGTVVGAVPGIDNSTGGNSYTILNNTSPFAIDSDGVLTVATPPSRTDRANVSMEIEIAKDGKTSVVQATVSILNSGTMASQHGARCDHWSSVSLGTNGAERIDTIVLNANYPDAPESTTTVMELRATDAGVDYFGRRYHGYLIPETTGEYQFAISADHAGRLNLSTTAFEDDLETIASIEGLEVSAVDEYDKLESQTSETITLFQGKVYYIEALHKDWQFADHLEVAWRRAGEASFSTIDSSVLLLPGIVDLVAPTTPHLVVDRVTDGNVLLTWSTNVLDEDIVGFALYRDGRLIETPEAGARSYTEALSAGTYTYALVAKDEFGNASVPSVLTIDTSANYDALETALETGNPRLLSGYTRILQAGIDEAGTVGNTAVRDLLVRFRDNTFNVNMALIPEGHSSDDPTLNSQFQSAALEIWTTLRGYDAENRDIFEEATDRLSRILVLIGDKFREDVVFPMDKTTTSNAEFFRSLFADHTVLYSRSHNPVQPDMGTFSRSDFSHITPVDRSASLTSKMPFRSVGLYALPGEVVTVTRTDSSAVQTNISVNSVRHMSTRLFDTNGYNRPRFVTSALISVGPGETISFTSPYGGPLQVWFDANDQSVAFDFQNVGEHAYWNGPEDNAVFAAKLAANEYDWAEIATNGFEVHSKTDKMVASTEVWGGAQQLAAATEHYIGNFPYALAGFTGEGIDVVPEISDFATTRGWTLDTITTVQHMNADQPTCGIGCSGNPYDAIWAFNPIAHGDVHELGHGLESARFRFTGWEVHATTNLYVYYTQSAFYKETGAAPDQLEMNFATTFPAIFNALNAGPTVAAGIWPGTWETQFTFYLQAAMSVQEMGQFTDGWHLFGRLHALEREFNRAIWNGTWDAKRDSLGFSSYSLEEARNITNDDWMAVAMSFVSGANFWDYLVMWGFTRCSLKAYYQVASFGFPAVPKRYFISTPTGFTSSDEYGVLLDRDYLVVNGTQTWPIASRDLGSGNSVAVEGTFCSSCPD